MASCSSDAEQTTINETNSANFKTKSAPTLEILYGDMINSQSYIAHQAAAKDFADKLNFSGNFADIDTEAEMLTWIRTNISITDFSSYVDAETEWENVQALGVAAVNDNFAFYEALEGVAPERIIQIIGPTDPPQTTQDCPQCESQFDTDINGLKHDYLTRVVNAIGGLLNGTMTGAEASAELEEAETSLILGTGAAASAFVDCCVGAQ